MQIGYVNTILKIVFRAKCARFNDPLHFQFILSSDLTKIKSTKLCKVFRFKVEAETEWTFSPNAFEISFFKAK